MPGARMEPIAQPFFVPLTKTNWGDADSRGPIEMFDQLGQDYLGFREVEVPRNSRSEKDILGTTVDEPDHKTVWIHMRHVIDQELAGFDDLR